MKLQSKNVKFTDCYQIIVKNCKNTNCYQIIVKNCKNTNCYQIIAKYKSLAKKKKEVYHISFENVKI